MKKILFILLCVLASSTALFASDHVINMTLTLGEPYTFTPIDDIGIPASKIYGSSDGTYESFYMYENAFSVVRESKSGGTFIVTNEYNALDRTKVQGYYYTYTLTPFNVGTYTFTTNFSWSDKKNIKVKDCNSEYITYNITILDVGSLVLPNTQTLTVGDTYTFTPTIIPSDATPSLTWYSSNPSVASVSDGKVTALSDGTTTITCMANNGVSASCEVTVKPQMNYLYSADFVGGAGGHVTVPILMKNDINVAGFQFDLTMPEGVTLTMRADGTADATVTGRTSTHTLSGTTLASGAVRFTAVSTRNALVTGTEGAVMNIRFDVDKDLPYGDYDVKFSNVQLTEKNGSDLSTVYAPDFTLKMTVGPIAVGDVNADGVVNVTDAIGIIGHIVEDTPTWFTESVADVNGDGQINVTDVVGVIDIILSQE